MRDYKALLAKRLAESRERSEREMRPEFRGSMRESRMDMAEASDRNALGAALMESAAQVGTLDGKAPDASSVGRFADRLNQGNRSFMDGLEGDRQDAGRSMAAGNSVLAKLAGMQSAEEQAKIATADKAQARQDALAKEERDRTFKAGEAEKDRTARHRDLLARLKATREAKTAAAAKPDKKQLRADQERLYRYNSLVQNAEKLKTLIAGDGKKKAGVGTHEAFGPEGDQMDSLIYQMAVDYAKMVDPESVAREGEVAAAQKYMLPVRNQIMGIPGTAGLGTDNETAVALIDNYIKDLDKRLEAQSAAKEGIAFTPSTSPEGPESGEALAGDKPTLVKKQYSPSRDQTKMTYSDGTEEIVDGKQ